MNLLVTGAHGQVGHAVAALARQRQGTVRAFARAEVDITDAEAVDRAISEASGAGPLAVINAAAYTAVDRAESETEAAFAVNRDGPAHLAASCARHGAALVHLSTDYVFDGTKGAPYLEDDAPNPLNVYGESKWAGRRPCARGWSATRFSEPPGCSPPAPTTSSARCGGWRTSARSYGSSPIRPGIRRGPSTSRRPR